jgi:lipoate-protein ligase A
VEIVSSEKGSNGKFCFQSPVPGDLMFGPFKIAGGAQRRRGRLLLHQGSIRMDKLQMKRDVLVKAILKTFTRTFGLDLKEGFDNLMAVKDSVGFLKEKYSSDAWTYKF